jgi:hypothetical protein
VKVFAAITVNKGSTLAYDPAGAQAQLLAALGGSTGLGDTCQVTINRPDVATGAQTGVLVVTSVQLDSDDHFAYSAGDGAMQALAGLGLNATKDGSVLTLSAAVAGYAGTATPKAAQP